MLLTLDEIIMEVEHLHLFSVVLSRLPLQTLLTTPAAVLGSALGGQQPQQV